MKLHFQFESAVCCAGRAGGPGRQCPRHSVRHPQQIHEVTHPHYYYYFYIIIIIIIKY